MPLIAICGTPGTGKSELAERLSKENFKVIHLSKFVIENRLYLGYDEKRHAYIIDEDGLAEEIRKVSAKHDRLIVEGVGAEGLPSDIVDLCIVLTCEPSVLRMRLSLRELPDEKIEENLEAERFGVVLGEAISNYGASKVVVIDTTYEAIESIARVVIGELHRRGII